MESGKRSVIIPVSAELLHELLMFPVGARVTGFRENIGCGNDVYELRVESDEFPLTPDNCAIPQCEASYEIRDGVPKFIGFRVRKGAPAFGSPEYHAAVAALKVAKEIQQQLNPGG